MNREGRLIVLVVVRFHRLDKADVIHALAQMRKQVADPRAAFAARPKLPAGLEQSTLLIRETAPDAHRLAVRSEELRFVIERVHVRHAAVREDENHPLGLGREMRWPRCERVGGVRRIRKKVRHDARQQQ